MKKLISLIGLIAMLTACSPYTLVNNEVYNDADLRQYSTFRIVTPGMGKLPPGMEMVTYYNIAAAIREEMVMRGFTESDDSPLLVNIAVTTQREIQTEPLVPPAGYFPYNGPSLSLLYVASIQLWTLLESGLLFKCPGHHRYI